MKNNQKRFGVVEGLIILGVAVLLIGLGWLVIDNQPKPLSTMLDTIKTDILNSFNDVGVEQKKWTAQNTTNESRKVEGYDYLLSPQSAATLSFMQKDSPEAKTVTYFIFFKKNLGSVWAQNGSISPLAEKVNNIFTKNKFTATKDGENTAFKRDNDTCLFSGTQLSCYNPEILKTIAEESKPFVDAYVATHSELKARDIVLGPVTIKSQDGGEVITLSNEADYDIAEAVVTVNDKKASHYITKHRKATGAI